ncbi:hypothetical protein BRDID11004_59650 [Bradyrhizobium diazoefficiens]|uniref:Uncharacterized protein n=1 Tax=Bradyrhizobium diazoefficiens TaxID=1355477 RepID=A0A810AF33_9BRAD|nr:hypothetical protein [Bradyrhizobium diazoefficiens]BBZ93136.1 hypothetical protein F07S3_29690 [Bradyrhizobium diazoefficiens]BCA10887.1 hypothetical protein BDHF08_27340 [Bradyrhizobium diazoefficiens]BCE55222.1 hypothetical protein XF5B_27340 [Bradyrhizobium diazoefficiens]BCE63956.1 hypothetical protein XF6B_27550 [Bradyrhizobium diazoefficiens]
MTTPYENASSGVAARDEITKLLRRFGCAEIGFLDNYEEHEVLLVFKHRGRQMQLRASAKGWAALYLKEHPYNYRHKGGEQQHREKALAQGHVAINSILRDWVKGQIMAVECGMLSFNDVFLPFMLTHDGRTISERADQLGLLPAGAAP